VTARGIALDAACATAGIPAGNTLTNAATPPLMTALRRTRIGIVRFDVWGR
jgi:hypothetical protein